MAGRLQPRRSIDQKECVVNKMSLAEFYKEHLGQRRGSGRKESHVQQAIRIGVNRRKQSVALAIQLLSRLPRVMRIATLRRL